MSGKAFFTIAAGFLIGIFLHSVITLGVSAILISGALGFCVLLFGFFKKEFLGRALLVALFIFSLTLGLARFHIIENTPDLLSSHAGRSELFEGIITEEPTQSEKSTHIVVSIEKVGAENVEGTVLLYVRPGVEFLYGERLRIFGEVEIPESFETDNGRIFDYKNYLAARGIEYIFIYPKVSVIGEGEGSKFKEKIFAVKNKFLDSINKNISAPESSLLAGLLLGVNDSLGKEWDEIFRRAGLSHIVVLSGYNLTIVALFIMWILQWLPFRSRLIASAGAIAVFAVMTGGSATVVRASAMALLVIFAHYLHRRYEVTRALVLAGVLMVFLSPKILVFDISFQLSFLATVGLIYISPILEKYFLWVTEKGKIREIVLATLSTQIFVTPFILWSMGQFSLVALPSNLLVLPIVPFSMLFGFIAGIIGLISSVLAFPFAYLTHILLHLELVLAKFFASLSFSAFSVPAFSPWWLLLIYLVLIFGIYLLNKRYGTVSSAV